MLTSLHAQPEWQLAAFDFFGSYLLEEVCVDSDMSADDDDGPSTVCDLLDEHRRASHVAHVRQN